MLKVIFKGGGKHWTIPWAPPASCFTGNGREAVLGHRTARLLRALWGSIDLGVLRGKRGKVGYPRARCAKGVGDGLANETFMPPATEG